MPGRRSRCNDLQRSVTICNDRDRNSRRTFRFRTVRSPSVWPWGKGRFISIRISSPWKRYNETRVVVAAMQLRFNIILHFVLFHAEEGDKCVTETYVFPTEMCGPLLECRGPHNNQVCQKSSFCVRSSPSTSFDSFRLRFLKFRSEHALRAAASCV